MGQDQQRPLLVSNRPSLMSVTSSHANINERDEVHSLPPNRNQSHLRDYPVPN